MSLKPRLPLTPRFCKKDMDWELIEAVAVVFGQEEWAMLDLAQRKLYRDVMEETLRNLATVVCQSLNGGEMLSTEHLMLRFMKSETWSSILAEIFASRVSKDRHENQRVNLRALKARKHCESNEGDLWGKTSSQTPNLPLMQRSFQEGNPLQGRECGKACMEEASRDHDIRSHAGCSVCEGAEWKEACSFGSDLTTPPSTLPGQESCRQKDPGNDFRLATLQNPMGAHPVERVYPCSQSEKDFCGFKAVWDPVSSPKCDPRKSSHSCSVRTSLISQETFPSLDKYACKECGKDFPHASTHQEHMRTHKGDEDSENKGCGEVFAQSSHRTRHATLHSGERPHGCPECGESFTQFSSLTAHRRIHTGERPYECKEGGQHLSSPQCRLQKRIHRGKGNYDCKECGKAFGSPSHLIKHARIHSGERPYGCPECGKTFTQSSALNAHRKIHSGQRPYECKECGKHLSSSQFRLHKRIHRGEGNYNCKECGKVFVNPSHLIRHARMHSGERPYECPECGKAFNQSSILITHRKTHSGEKPFHCKECGKRFSLSASLRVHMRIHKGERNYECEECGKAFTQSSHLIRHARVHSGERPYECTQCGKSFSQSSGLSMHRRTHSVERPFECKACGKGFKLPVTLRTHMRTHSQGEGRIINASNVGTPSLNAHTSSDIRDSTVGEAL